MCDWRFTAHARIHVHRLLMQFHLGHAHRHTSGVESEMKILSAIANASTVSNVIFGFLLKCCVFARNNNNCLFFIHSSIIMFYCRLGCVCSTDAVLFYPCQMVHRLRWSNSKYRLLCVCVCVLQPTLYGPLRDVRTSHMHPAIASEIFH